MLRACAAIAVFLLLGTRIAVASAPTDNGVLEPFRFVPPSPELIVVIENGTSWRRSAIGSTISDLGQRLGALDSIQASWNSLAQRIGMSPESLFDALLGERAVFVVDITPKTTPSWVFVADISERTAAALTRGLRARPRDEVAGHAVMSIEDGAYELALIRSREANRLVLAPRESRELMRQTVARAKGRTIRSFADGPQASRLRAFVGVESDDAQQGRVLAFSRTPGRRAAVQESYTDWFCIFATMRSSDHAEFDLLVRDEKMVAAAGNLEAWSLRPFEALLASSSMCTVIGATGVSPWLTGEALLLGMPISLTDHLQAHGVAASRCIMAAHQGQTGTTSLVASIETNQVDAIEEIGDEVAMGGLAPLILWPPDLAMPPEHLADRIESLLAKGIPDRRVDEDGMRRMGVGNHERARAFGTEIELAWKVTPGPPPTDTRPGCATSWWTVGLGDPDVVREISQLGSERHLGLGQPWLAIVTAKPRELLASQTLPAMMRSRLSLFSGVEFLHWHTAVGPDNLILGNGEIRVQSDSRPLQDQTQSSLDSSRSR